MIPKTVSRLITPITKFAYKRLIIFGVFFVQNRVFCSKRMFLGCDMSHPVTIFTAFKVTRAAIKIIGVFYTCCHSKFYITRRTKITPKYLFKNKQKNIVTNHKSNFWSSDAKIVFQSQMFVFGKVKRPFSKMDIFFVQNRKPKTLLDPLFR